VHVSSIAVHGAAPAAGPVYTEDLPLAEHAEMAVYSRTKLQAETALAEVAQAQGLDYVVLRPPVSTGPTSSRSRWSRSR
jgi:nucleoside-diphosphate-sugar epimerase